MPKSLAPLFICTAVFVLGIEIYNRRRIPTPPRLIFFLCCAIFFWSVASLFWTISPSETRRLILPIAGLNLAGLLLFSIGTKISGRDLIIIKNGLNIGLVIGLFIILFDTFFPLTIINIIREPIMGYKIGINYTYLNTLKNGANIASLLIFPALFFIWIKYGANLSIFLIIFSIFILASAHAGAAALGILVGLVGICITIIFRRHSVKIFAVIIIVNVMAMPLIPKLFPSPERLENLAPQLPNSIFPRIFIWKSASKIIADDPILGKGLNTSRVISTSKDFVVYSKTNYTNRGSVPIPLHPHNFILQIWLELGAVGAVILISILLAINRAIYTSFDNIIARSAAYGSYFTALSVASVSYGIWQTWWLSGLWLVAIFTTLLIRPPEHSAESA